MVRPWWILGAFGASATAAALLLGDGAPLAAPLLLAPASDATPPTAIDGSAADVATAVAIVRTPAPDPVDDEADIATATAAPLPGDDAIAGLIEALRNDGIRGNATRALDELLGAGEAAVPQLEAGLAAYDRQQRQLCGLALRCLGARRSAALIEVSVEGLRRDVSAELYSTIIHPMAASSTRWLLDRTGPARPQLRAALQSGDEQQRFLAAFLLASGGHQDDREVVVRELVHHLADNQIEGDALMATTALYRLGAPSAASMTAWRNSVDDQARSLIDLVAADLQAPPRTLEDLKARKRMHKATTIYHDPAVEFDIGRSRIATW